MGTRWYQLVSNNPGASGSWKTRESLKRRQIVKAEDIVIQGSDKTLIRINDKKLAELNEWVQGIPKKSFIEYTKGMVPSEGNTFWTRCGWRMMLSMQKMHEVHCKDCIAVAKDRRNGSDAIGITASGDLTVPTVKGKLSISDQPSLHTSIPVGELYSGANLDQIIKVSGKSTSVATKYGSMDSGIRQVAAQEDVAHIFEALEGARVGSTEPITKERWEEVRDESLKLHNHAIEEIKRIDEEDAERNQMRDEIRTGQQALEEKIKQFEEKFG